MGKILIGILTLFLLIGPFRTPIIEGIHDWRSSDTSESSVVVTAAGVTSTNVTLGHHLFQAATSEIIAVSSNITETPVASSYTEDTKVLLVSALDPNETRTLTVQYYAETDDTVMRALGPFLSVLIFGGCAFANLYGIWQGLHKGRR